MMNNKAHDLSSYSFSPGEQVLVDANIWLYLFPAPSKPNKSFAKKYSDAFSRLVQAKGKPIIDHMVLSEYLNRYCRIEYEGGFKGSYATYKDFRNSSDFQTVSSAAKIFVTTILSICRSHTVAAHELDLNKAVAAFESGMLDFNDALFVDICKQRNLKLMTNDGDFLHGGIDVLTVNPRLLQACP